MLSLTEETVSSFSLLLLCFYLFTDCQSRSSFTQNTLTCGHCSTRPPQAPVKEPSSHSMSHFLKVSSLVRDTQEKQQLKSNQLRRTCLEHPNLLAPTFPIMQLQHVSTYMVQSVTHVMAHKATFTL